MIVTLVLEKLLLIMLPLTFHLLLCTLVISLSLLEFDPPASEFQDLINLMGLVP